MEMVIGGVAAEKVVKAWAGWGGGTRLTSKIGYGGDGFSAIISLSFFLFLNNFLVEPLLLPAVL